MNRKIRIYEKDKSVGICQIGNRGGGADEGCIQLGAGEVGSVHHTGANKHSVGVRDGGPAGCAAVLGVGACGGAAYE